MLPSESENMYAPPQHDLRIREWAEIAHFSLIFYLFGNFSNFQIDKKSSYQSEVQRNDIHDSDFFIISKHHTKNYRSLCAITTIT